MTKEEYRKKVIDAVMYIYECNREKAVEIEKIIKPVYNYKASFDD